MIDIITNDPALDMGVFSTQTPRAANILSVQIGSLEYEPDLGIDLNYFLSEDFKFQNESFKAYCVEVLAGQGINVSSVTQEIQALAVKMSFNLTPEETTTGLIAR